MAVLHVFCQPSISLAARVLIGLLAGLARVPDAGALTSWTLQGRVFDGEVGNESTPLSGVTVSVFGANGAYPVPGRLIRSSTTDSSGWYGITVSDSDGTFEYYYVLETDPAGYTSAGVSSVSGFVRTSNWIEYAAPLTGKTLTGNKFWDRSPSTATPTVTRTSTRTPTGVLPTAPATASPTRTNTRATETPTRSPTPTTTLPPDCFDALGNGDFGTGSFPPWGSSGAVSLGLGRNGTLGAWLGGVDNASAELWQGVFIPVGAAPVRLEFWLLAESGAEQPADLLDVVIQGTNGAHHLLTVRALEPIGQWRQEVVDVGAYSAAITVTFLVQTDGAVPSTFWLDDVSLKVCGVPTPTFTTVPTSTPTITPTPVPATNTPTGTRSGTPTPTQTKTLTRTATNTPTSTATTTTTRSVTPSRTATPTLTATQTSTSTSTVTASISPTRTPTPTGTATTTRSVTATRSTTPTLTVTPTGTFTPTVTATASPTRTSTPTGTAGATRSFTAPPSLTATPTGTHTGTFAPTVTSTVSRTPTATASRTRTTTATMTGAVPASPTPTRSASATQARSATPTPTQTASIDTPTATPSPLALLRFAGHVSATRTLQSLIPVEDVQVALYGSTAAGELGTWLASSDSAADGSYEIDYTHGRRTTYEHFQIAISDARFSVTEATSDSGGQVDPLRWIEFSQPAPGLYSNNDFVVALNATPTPSALHAVITFEEAIFQPERVLNQYCNNRGTNRGAKFTGTGGRIYVPGVSTASGTHGLTSKFPGDEFGAFKKITVEFTNSQSQVSAKVGLDKTYSFPVTAYLRAYDGGSTLLATSTLSLGNAPTSVTQLLSVSGSGRIRKVEFEFKGPAASNAAYEVIDDLAFDVPGGSLCISDSTAPAVQITKPASDGQAIYNPSFNLAFVASDNESGVAKTEVSFLDPSGASVGGSFNPCGGTSAFACGAASRLSFDFTTALPQRQATVIRVTAWDYVGHASYADRRVTVQLPGANTNLWVQGMEVTQGIQPWLATSTTSRSTNPPAIQVPPASVPLVAEKRTVVRVYPGIENSSGIAVVGAEASLTCTNLVGAPCAGQWSAAPVAPITVDPADQNDLNTLRAKASKSWSFVLPEAWTDIPQTPLLLTARVHMPQGISECAGCNDGANGMTVSNVWFSRRAPLKIAPFWFCVRRNASDPTSICDQAPVSVAQDVLSRSDSLFVKTYPVAEKNFQIVLRPGNTLPVDGDFSIPEGWVTTPVFYKLQFLLCNLRQLDMWLNSSFFSPPPAPVYFGIVPVGTTFVSGLGSPGLYCATAKLDPNNLAADAATAAQEVGHTLGLDWHASCDHGEGQVGYCLAVPQRFPCAHGSICTYGFDPSAMKPVPPGDRATGAHTHDFMSYGDPPKWISPYTFESLYDLVGPLVSGASNSRAAGRGAAEEQGLWVSGDIALEQMADVPGELGPAYHFGRRDVPHAAGQGAFSVELQDGEGRTLFARFFDVEETLSRACCDPNAEPPQTARFFEMVPFDDSTARIVLKRGNEVLAQRLRSAQPPSVRILAPDAGETWGANETHEIRWSGSDPDPDDALFFVVEHSSDGGTTWSTLASDATENSLAVDSAQLPGSSRTFIRVLVSDGINTASAVAGPFTVGRKPPLAWITGPTADEGAIPVFQAGAQVTLQGNATDWEDGPLGDEVLTWTSDRDGPLGVGHGIDVTTLSPGVHEITLTARDSDGETGASTAGIEIAPPINTQPQADAGPDRTVGPGGTVQLDGTGSSDRDVQGLGFVWSIVATSPGLTPTLSDPEAAQPSFFAPQGAAGYALIELIVNDGIVSSLPDSVLVTVEPPQTTLSGRVFEGDAGDESNPLNGVDLRLYGSNRGYPDLGTLLASTTTDAMGWYGLALSGGFEYYHLVSTKLPGHAAVAAATIGGIVGSETSIEYRRPLDGKTLVGNNFWQRRSADVPHTCVGDCDGNRKVTIAELISGVNIALGKSTRDACEEFDPSGDGRVSIHELVQGVNAALNGCRVP